MPKNIEVAVIVGSKSDLEFMEPAFSQLDELDVAWDKKVLSAHRRPEELDRYVTEVSAAGVRVIIAAAGLSAALPGVVASKTLVPVIGVPVPGGPLRGIDALLSIIQMPGGIPVAAVGLGSQGPRNAALLAAEILALQDRELRQRLEAKREQYKQGR
jgi:5-(carboxyamino)imidazole ribonucleotide mutase